MRTIQSSLRPASLIVVAGCCLGFAIWRSPATAQQDGRTAETEAAVTAPRSIIAEMRNPDFLKELKLSDQQLKEFGEIQQENFKVLRMRMDDRKAQLRKELEERTLKLLSEEQLAVWTKRQTQLDAEASGTKAATPNQPSPPAGAPTVTPSTPVTTPTPAAGTTAPATTPAAPVTAPRTFPSSKIPANAKPVVSFGSAKTESFDADAKLSFNFQYAPWKEVLELFAKTADMTLDLQDVPPDAFSYRDSRSYSPTQALDVINGYLLSRGYIVVRRDRFLVCLNIANGIPPNLAPEISEDELPERGKHELVSLVIPLKGIQADQVVAEVRELLGPQGKASALKNTNSIVVTDIGSHVRRIHALLTSGTIDNRDTAFKSIPLKHISANEAERMVRRLFGLSATNAAPASAQPQMAWQPQPGQNWGGGGWGGRRRDRDGEGEQPQQPPPPQQQPPAPVTPQGNTQFNGKIHVTADVRTNHLLVTASASLLQVVEDAVKTLDTNVDAEGNEIRRENVPMTVKTYSVPSADVTSIANTINMLVPGVVLGQDTKIGKLYIQATADEHKEVTRLVEEFSAEGSSSVAVVYLQKMEPVTLANTLNNLYSKDGGRAPTVEADPLGRRLILRGTPDQIVQMRTILAQLGEGDGAARDDSKRGTTRSLMLGGRDPEELLPLLKDAWTTSRPNPIRIKIPSAPKPIRDRAVPGAERKAIERREPFGEAPSTAPAVFRSASLKSADEEQDSGESSAEAEERDSPPPPSPPEDATVNDRARPKSDDSAPVALEVVGDQLIISSPNQETLDQLEELYERLAAAIPARTKWNVFYLRSADATEAAQMLERLFPQSNVSTTTSSSGSGLLGSVAGGMNTIGRGLMNMSGLQQTLSGSQTLRIVTDIRSNALFVSGPHDVVAEVEQVLEVLDSSELPTLLRDRLPRTIAVEHADVEEVAEVVETVFKDAMTPENQIPGQRGGGFNPLMLMMGGGGGNNQQGGRRQPTVQLTLGIDKRTSHLIVSCNDQLYQQIEEMVQGLDERAKKSRQTVRMVKLNQADPTLVQQTLGSIMKKVTVGTTRRSRRTNNGTDAGPSSVSSSGGPSGNTTPNATSSPPPDRMRDAVIQRMMMDRMNRGGNREERPFGQ